MLCCFYKCLLEAKKKPLNVANRNVLGETGESAGRVPCAGTAPTLLLLQKGWDSGKIREGNAAQRQCRHGLWWDLPFGFPLCVSD